VTKHRAHAQYILVYSASLLIFNVILSRVYGSVTNNVFGLDGSHIDAFCYSLSYLQSVIALPLIYSLHKSLGNVKSSQSSLVVSWQRIYNSLPVTAAYIKSPFYKLTPLYSFSSHSSGSIVLLAPSVLILRLTAHLEFRVIQPRGGSHGKRRLSTIRRSIYRSVALKLTSFYC
jgi:hypothetical protein